MRVYPNLERYTARAEFVYLPTKPAYPHSEMPAAARLNILGSQLNTELVEYSSGGIDKNPRIPQR